MLPFEKLLGGFEGKGNIRLDTVEFLKLHHCSSTAEHSLRVADQAASLAIRFGLDPGLAETAGLLHDISAVYPNNERISIAKALEIPVLPEEETFPMILHQKISRVMANQIFGVTNDSVLSAIECHTTLKASPSKLDMILFVADKIQWDQSGTPPYIDELYKGLDQSLEHASFAYIAYLWSHKDKLRVIHPWLREAYHYFSNKVQ
jgi:predicted HD superfamily hydrolase involved in NAD metabolism